MTHCHHCICIIVLYQVLPSAQYQTRTELEIVTTNVPAGRQSVLSHLTELLELITECSHLIFYWPLTNVHLLLTTIIDTIYLAKLFLIDNLSCFIV